ncbi:MAG: hypothetical protein H6R18_593 [Proteobacteria bacterium]|nr:hypothetical protein [Pseudomonadota bacterium]
MSYILEALRESDLERQRGMAPTLTTAQMLTPVAVAPRKPMLFFFGLTIALVLSIGVIIGWLRPWQTEQTPFVTSLTTPPAALIDSAPVSAPKLAPDAKLPKTATRQSTNKLTAAPTPTPASKTKPLDSSSQRLQKMTISVHAYSSNAANRKVWINDRMLREGDAVAPGLKLEQITEDGIILNSNGNLFRRGLR